MSKTYSEKLRDPRWQKLRLVIMQRDNFCCQICRDDETTLNVHHRRYLPDHEPWEYEEHDLVTLCEPCHRKEQTAWTDCMGLLRDTLCKRGYFAEDVKELASVIFHAPGNYEEFLTLIVFLVNNEEAFDLISKLYHKNSNRSGAVTPAHLCANEGPEVPAES